MTRRRGPRIRGRHLVRCPACKGRFELFGAGWCACDGPDRSKVCPRCSTCACSTPGYRNPRLWALAPPVFRKHGFERLFIAYL